MSEWKLVPVEPTEKMVDSAMRARAEERDIESIEGAACFFYRAMLAAAPAHPQHPAGGQPVAWQFRCYYDESPHEEPGWGSWQHCTEERYQRLKDRHGFEVCALYTAPTVAQAAPADRSYVVSPEEDMILGRALRRSSALVAKGQPVGQGEWLTDEQIIDIRDGLLPSQGESFDCIAFARAVLAARPAQQPTHPDED